MASFSLTPFFEIHLLAGSDSHLRAVAQTHTQCAVRDGTRELYRNDNTIGLPQPLVSLRSLVGKLSRGRQGRKQP